MSKPQGPYVNQAELSPKYIDEAGVRRLEGMWRSAGGVITNEMIAVAARYEDWHASAVARRQREQGA